MKIQYALMSCTADPRYTEYWPTTARCWLKLGITPVCLFIPNKPSPKLPEIPGSIVHIVSPLDGVHITNQAMMLRFWASHLYPDATVIVSDIDFIPLSKDFFCTELRRYPEEAYIHLQTWKNTPSHTGYPLTTITNIPEKITQIERTRYLTAVFHVAKGTIMRKVLELPSDWNTCCRKIIPYYLGKTARIKLVNSPNSGYDRATPCFGDEIYITIRLHHSNHHPIIYSPHSYQYDHIISEQIIGRFIDTETTYIGIHLVDFRYSKHKETIEQLIKKEKLPKPQIACWDWFMDFTISLAKWIPIVGPILAFILRESMMLILRAFPQLIPFKPIYRLPHDKVITAIRLPRSFLKKHGVLQLYTLWIIVRRLLPFRRIPQQVLEEFIEEN